MSLKSLMIPLATQGGLTPTVHSRKRTVAVHSRHSPSRCNSCSSSRTGTRKGGPAPGLLAALVAAQAFLLPGPVLSEELPPQSVEFTGIEAGSQSQGAIPIEGLPAELMLVAAETPVSAAPSTQQESSSPAPLTKTSMEAASPAALVEQLAAAEQQSNGAGAQEALQPPSAMEEFQVADTSSVEGIKATAEDSADAAAATPSRAAAGGLLVAEAPAVPAIDAEPASGTGRAAESINSAAEEFAVAEAPEEPASVVGSLEEPAGQAAEEFVVAEAAAAPAQAAEPASPAAPEEPSLLADESVPAAGDQPVAEAPPPAAAAVPVSTAAAETGIATAEEPNTTAPAEAAPANTPVEVAAEPAGSSGSSVSEAELEQERELVAEIEKELPQVEEQLAALEAAATTEPQQQLLALEKELQVIEEETAVLEDEEVRTPGAVGLVAEAKGILSQLATLKTLLRDLSDSFLFGN